MKLSKSILTLIVAGSTVALVNTSCEKEEMELHKNNQELPECGFGDDDECQENPKDDCPACGMG